jgi:hypothetical protein
MSTFATGTWLSPSEFPNVGSNFALDGWVLKVGELLIPMVAAMRRELISGSYIQAEETPVDLQTREGRGQNHQAISGNTVAHGSLTCLKLSAAEAIEHANEVLAARFS